MKSITSHTVKLLAVAIVMGTFSFAAPVRANAQTVDRPSIPSLGVVAAEQQGISFLLSAYHALPAKAEFERAARQPVEVLRAIATRGEGVYAERAIEALFYWPSAEGLAFTVSMLEADDATAGRKHRLLMGISKHYPQQAFGLLEKYIQSDDRGLRITAAAALQNVGSAQAFELLDQALLNESDLATKAAMERYARRLR